MTQHLLIDDVRRDDLDQIIQIEQDAFVTPWHVESLEAGLKRPRTVFIALRQGERILGYGLTWLVADEMHILKLAVHKDFRRRGYGSMLIAETLRRGRDQSAHIAWLEVRPTNNAAQEMYKANGFRTAFLRKKYYSDTGEDAIILVRNLKAEEAD